MKRFMQFCIGVLSLAVATLIGFYVGSRPASAEPDSTTRYLMDDPLTMLEWGNHRFEEAINDWVRTTSKSRRPASVRYDWEKNRIDVNLIYAYDTLTAAEARTLAESGFHEIRSWCRTGLEDNKYELLGDYYTHSGFRPNGEPEKLGLKLAPLVELSFQTRSTDGQLIQCRGQLTDDETLWNIERPKK